MKSGKLNFLEPSGPLQACNGTDLPLLIYIYMMGGLSFVYLILLHMPYIYIYIYIYTYYEKQLLVSLCPSVCLSVRLFVRMEQLCYHWPDFHEIWYLSIFRKCVWKIKFTLKSDKNNGHEGQCMFLIMSRSFLLGMRNISNKCCRDNQNTQFMFHKFFFPRKSCRLWDNVEKYGRAGQATDTTHARCMLNT